jgi:GNAT superfamily N-acetyltransferase
MAAIDQTASEAATPPKIERLTPGDAEALCPLSIEAGWNQVAADWRLMLTLGRGFGVRGTDGRWIGSALSLPLGPGISWLSMVLVTQPARGKGLGTRLLSRCLAEVAASGDAAGLDATELGRPIYLPLGFRDVFPLSRWHAGRGARDAVAPPPGIVIRAATPEDAQRISAYDCPRCGFARGSILMHLLSRAPRFAHIATQADGTLAGYVLARDGYRTAHIGPVVADDEVIGLALLSSAFAVTAEPLIVDVPDAQTGICRWLEQQGASAPRRFMRMLRGGEPATDASRVFALAGPELA